MTNLENKNKPVKICIMATVPISICTFYGKQIDFLTSKGFDVTVITSADEAGTEKQISSSAKVYLVPLTRSITPLKDISCFKKILDIIAKGDFDIVQYSSPKAALLGSLAAWLCRVPVRLYLMWGMVYVTQSGIKRLVLKSMEKIICFLSTQVSPDSKGNCSFAVEEKLSSAKKVSLVSNGSANGIDLLRYDPRIFEGKKTEVRRKWDIPDNVLVIGFVGRLRKEKGVNELVMAFEKLLKKYTNLYLLIVGPEEIQNKELLRDVEYFIKNDPRIVCVGYQDKPEEFMAAMDIFVLPSYREGFGLVNLEASAMRLPVVSTDIPGPRDSVINNETGFLVQAQSIDSLFLSMEKLIKNKDLRIKMGEAGRIWSSKFEQSNHWKNILQHRLMLLNVKGSFIFDKDQMILRKSG